ncbi:MAG TPA: hypothetical protein VGE01_13735 [Fimbriimonas sp.]
MRPWQFGKPKTPGFGISKGYYLSVLLSRATLPTIYQVVNPKQEEGAVEGFGVPLGTDDKASLHRPLERGYYAVATKDRKTVMRMAVLPKEEAGFDPEVFARSPLAASADTDLVARVRATWTLAQLTFESHDPMVYEALDFQLRIAQRLAQLSDGVVADPIAQRYILPERLFHERTDPRIDVRDHVSIGFRARPEGIEAHTLGLQKFSLPEIQILGLLADEQEAAGRVLLAAAQSVLLGNLIEPGDRVGPFQASEGGFDKAMWEGIPVLELLPPTTQTTGEALRRWMP